MTKEELRKEAEEKGFEYIPKSKSNELARFSREGYVDGYLAGAEPREKQIARLQKSLLDVSEKATKRITELETRCTELFLQNNEFAERFEKSIEIIKGLLSCCRNYPQENAEKMEQTEQFLRETDIDNAIQQANEGLDLDKVAEEVEEDLKEGCPDVLCEDCKKEDCIVRKLGLVPTKEIEK